MSLREALMEEGSFPSSPGLKAASPSTLDLTDACISHDGVHHDEKGAPGFGRGRDEGAHERVGKAWEGV